MLSTIAFVFLGVAVVAATAVFFLRARRREEDSADAGAAASDGLAEMRALGQRIETLVGQQQLQGETSRQHLSQKLDSVGEHVEQHRTHLAGLQNELRHEVHRRDAEMDEIRTQLASIQHASLQSALAPPPAAAPFALAPRLAPPPMPGPAPSPVAAPFPAEPTGDGLAAAFGGSPTADGWDTGAAPVRLTNAAPPAAGLFTFADPFASASFDTTDPFDIPVPSAAPPFAAPADDEPVTAASSEFEPFDYQPPTGEDGLLPLGPIDGPAFSSDDDSTLFEDLSFGGPAAVSFGAFASPASQARHSAEVTAAAPAPGVPAPPSESAWIARAGRPGTEGLLPIGVATDEFFAPAFETPAFDAPAFETPAFDAPVPSVAVPAFQPPAFETAAFAAPAPAEAPTPATAPPLPANAALVVPPGADDLTIIMTIDADVQNALYLAGVTSLDEIARWSRADARRIAADVGISEETIMNQWIFEAQAALFQSHTSR